MSNEGRDTVIIHRNMVAGLKELPPASAWEIMEAFFAVRFDGAKVESFPAMVRFALRGMMATVSDFDERFQRTKEARAEAGRKSGEARRAKAESNKTNKTNKGQQNERVGVGVGVGVGEDLKHLSADAAAQGDSHLQDSLPGLDQPPAKKPSTKGTRWTEGEPMPPDWLNWAKENTDHTEIGIRAQFERFSDYWVSQPGQKGVKANWKATWRSWMRSPYNQTAAGGHITQAPACEPGKPPIDWSQH